jgi:hypothetical protein
MELLVTSWAGVKAHANIANARPTPNFDITFLISCDIAFSFSELVHEYPTSYGAQTPSILLGLL